MACKTKVFPVQQRGLTLLPNSELVSAEVISFEDYDKNEQAVEYAVSLGGIFILKRKGKYGVAILPKKQKEVEVKIHMDDESTRFFVELAEKNGISMNDVMNRVLRNLIVMEKFNKPAFKKVMKVAKEEEKRLNKKRCKKS
jgi:hypothetical protein